MISAPAPLTRCEVPYCRGYTRLARRVRYGRYLCYRPACLVPEDVWRGQDAALGSYGEHRAWWIRCCEIAVERAL